MERKIREIILFFSIVKNLSHPELLSPPFTYTFLFPSHSACVYDLISHTASWVALFFPFDGQHLEWGRKRRQLTFTEQLVFARQTVFNVYNKPDYSYYHHPSPLYRLFLSPPSITTLDGKNDGG